jgi:hypothetical protein
VIRAVFSMLLLSVVVFGIAAAENDHEELGTIRWLRYYDTALRRARREGKPVLILFQEVPGCSTCRNYGLRVLSHPLLAEAAEQLFVPLAVFNNRSGEDAEVLRIFQEPSWNNPVVRIIAPSGDELTQRLGGDYSPGGFSAAMIDALTAFGASVPAYLEIAHAELSAWPKAETALLSMFCFWEGEIKLGAIPGVIATKAGFIRGSEVVQVHFDSRLLSYDQLLRRALRLRCADRAFPLNPEQRLTAEKVLGAKRVGSAVRFGADANTKYYLSKTEYRFLPMTDIQMVRVNIALYRGMNPTEVLSPRQQEALMFIRRHPEYPWRDLINSADFPKDWEIVWEMIGK